jgi:SPP1 gp7 family putative phage head morphogenesis protein
LTKPTTDIRELALKPFNKLKKEASALYQDSMMAGLETLALDMGTALDIELLRRAEAVAFLKKKLIRLVGEDGIQKTVSKQLNTALVRGMELGETIDQIADRIRGKFTSAASRAKTIARTEVYGAMNFARKQGMVESPFTREVWFTSLDERVRESHAEMHGETKQTGEAWIVGGASLEFPGDPEGPAEETINCRCIAVPDITSVGGS